MDEPQTPVASTGNQNQETFVVPTEIPQGGITFDPQAFPAQGAPSVQPPPPPEPALENPFIPQVAAPVTGGGGATKKRILMILVFILFALGLVAGGKLVLGLIAGSKEVTISYWGLWENDATVRSVIADFESKNPKIKVSYVKQSPRQYRERLSAAIARGEGPDVFRFHNTWVAMLAGDLAVVPKTIMTPTEFSSTFYPVAKNDLVAGNAIYGVPMMTDGLGLYINEDLFAKAGASTPVTWEDVLTIVPKLTVKTDSAITTSAIALGTTKCRKLE